VTSERASWAGSPSAARRKVWTGTSRVRSAQLLTAEEEPLDVLLECTQAHRARVLQGSGGCIKFMDGLAGHPDNPALK
jgi:hypothetical protein